MITNAKVVQGMDYIKNETPVKFKSFGIFFLKLLMLSIKDQEFIVTGLKNAADKAGEIDMIKVISFSRPKIKLKENEQQFRFLIEHEFRCCMCSAINSKEINICSEQFGSVCEICYDKGKEYENDSVANQLYD